MSQMFAQAVDRAPDMAIAAGTDIAEPKPTAYAAAPAWPFFAIAGADGGADAGMAISKLCDTEFDVVVDFSHPSMLKTVLGLAVSRSVPAVIATTGFSEAQQAEITAASEKIPILQTANMSIGINLMSELLKTAAAVLADGFDIEIVEAHHSQKLDAPSGTALMLANAINEELPGGREYVYDRHAVRAKRDKNEIGIHTIRGGTIVGEHKVIFAGNNEVLEISHSAGSREVFAEGAVRAVRFIAENGRKPGRYTIRDVVRASGK